MLTLHFGDVMNLLKVTIVQPEVNLVWTMFASCLLNG
jgi:hypothetical protein